MNKKNKYFSKRYAFLLGGILVLFSFTLLAEAQSHDHRWQMPTRAVPTPASSSDEMQNILKHAVAPNVEVARQFSLNDKKEWRKYIDDQADSVANVARLTKKLADGLSISIKKDEVAGVTIRHVVPDHIALEHKDHIFIHLHGGAFILYGGEASVGEAVIIASRAKIPVISVDYRMPPDHPFPAAIDDVVRVYKHLLKEYPAEAIAIGGSSAGGGLTLATVHKIIELKLKVPGALFAGTPWSDLTKTGDSLYTNEGLDRSLVTYDGFVESAAKLYAGSYHMKNPLVSPIYGNFEGFPPTYLVTGTRDLLLSDTVRTHRKLRVAGVLADLNVYEGLSHADYAMVVSAPESKQAYGELGSFLLDHLQ